MKNQTGCFLPLSALAVHPHGERKFCLTFNPPLSEKNVDFNLQRIETHKALLAGEWPEGCRFCKNAEARGVQSRRTRTWERKSASYGSEESFQMLKEQVTPFIRHLEITFSNLCNLSCAMCTSEFSSSWVKLDQEALDQGLSFREFTRPFQKVNRITKPVMDEVLKHVYEYDLIIIKGGEPTIEPLCLEFLKQIGQLRPKEGPYVFIQTNGTRNPSEWLPSLQGLKAEIGFSLDGWGKIGSWIRGINFEEVLNNFKVVHDNPLIEEVTIDFCLSLFNCFHLCDFFEEVILLKKQYPKFKKCPVFLWVQQHYGSPLVLDLEIRLKIRDKVALIFAREPELFVNHENLLKILESPRLPENSILQAKQWINYMNSVRGISLYDLQPELAEALNV